MRLRYLMFAGLLLVAAGCGKQEPMSSSDVSDRNLTVLGDMSLAGSSDYCTDKASSSSAALAKAVGVGGAPPSTIFATDFVVAGVGGMRNTGVGTITLAGVTGPVSQALLYWHGPTNSVDPDVNANVAVNGVPVSGTNIGFSDNNCWGYLNSQAYVADVTGIVLATGNGAYDLTGFGSGSPANSNGASLIVFFDDGNPANNRDVVVFHGNDSNINSAYDSPGWTVTLPGINYVAGTANLQLHVGDGQTFTDDALVVNGTTIEPTGPIFQGSSVPAANNGPSGDGNLWDIRTFDVTPLLSAGPNTLTLTTGVAGDCLSLVVAVIDLPAGAAPEQPNDPPDCSSAVPSITEIWPPNHTMVDVAILGVTDPDDDPVTIVIDAITQDEPLDTLGDGTAEPDGAGVGTDTAQLRAERSGSKKVPGNGRVYEIHFTATDDEGASCSSVTVCVPHDQGGGATCIDDGQVYDSTGN